MCDLCRHKRIKCEWVADEEESDRGSSPAPTKAGPTPAARRGARRKKPAAKLVEGDSARATKDEGGTGVKRSVVFAPTVGKGRAATEGM